VNTTLDSVLHVQMERSIKYMQKFGMKHFWQIHSRPVGTSITNIAQLLSSVHDVKHHTTQQKTGLK